MFDLDIEETTFKKPQIIVYGVKFLGDNNKILHSAQCDFRVVNSRLDFKTCPIISALIRANMPHRLQIDTDFSVDVNVNSNPGIILPKGIDALAHICEKCSLKHQDQKSR